MMGEQQDKKTVDAEIERQLKDIDEQVNRNFISNYEIAAQDIVEYIQQDRTVDFVNKVEQLGLDLFIGGEAYFKADKSSAGTNVRLTVCDPINTWVDKDPKNRYMKNGYKSVVRKWMSVEEIEYVYGDSLTKKDLDSLHEHGHFHEHNDHFLLITGQEQRCGNLRNPGYLHGVGAHPYDDEYIFDEYRWDLIPVYEVEWIDSVKKDNKWKGNCYKVTRIGSDIYILDGEDEDMQRNPDSPNEPRLSINGIWYTNGHGAPYSLMLATADIQDNYDMLIYQRDNLIALSGTAGAIVDVSQLPEFLGDDLEERLIRFQAYRKVGLSVIDTSQEGSQQQNTFYGGFNDTQGLQAIQYIQLAIQQLEDTVSSITGVFRERLGGIQPRDAVQNVEAGMQQSFVITKRYYNALDSLVEEVLMDCLDVAKIVYRKGLSGQLIIGDQRQIFNILPKYYTSTSYDIRLADSAKIIKEQELIKQLALQLASQNQLDPEILFIVSTSKSLTEMKDLALKSIHQKKIENDQIQQLQQALQQAQQSQEQMQRQLEASTKKITQLNSKKLAIEEQNNRAQQSIDWFKAKNDVDIKNKELDLMRDRNKLEALQLVDDNPNNDEVLDNKY